MLAQLAQTLRQQRATAVETDDEDGTGLGPAGGRVVLGDDCVLM